MKYDWKKIIEDQKCSGLTVTQYCHDNNIATCQFYSNRKRVMNQASLDDAFLPVEVMEPASNLISMIIDGHTVEFDSSLLDRVIGALR